MPRVPVIEAEEGLTALTSLTSQVTSTYMLREKDITNIRNVVNEGITALVLPQFDEVRKELGDLGTRLDRIEAHVADIRNRILADHLERIERIEQVLHLERPR